MEEDSSPTNNHKHNITLSIKSNHFVDPNEVLELNFDKFISDLKENLLKKKYRKILDDIKDREKLFTNCKFSWKITEIKCTAISKIIERKLYKYSQMSQVGGKIKGLETWLFRLDLEISSWMDSISNNSTYRQKTLSQEEINQLEICVSFILKIISHFYENNMQEKLLADAVASLSLAERLIIIIADLTSNPDTLNISSKLLLNISSLLIAENNFILSKKYLEKSITLSLKELTIRIDPEEGINFNFISTLEKHFLVKCFYNIIIAFYQIGVCEENLGNIKPAIEAYKQSKWFAYNYIKSETPELVQFLTDVEKRAMNYHTLISNIKENQTNFKQFDDLNSKTAKSALFYDEMNPRGRKFEETKQMIEIMKIPEIEDSDNFEKKSENIKNILSTVKLVNNLMSDPFKDLIKSMDKLEINKLDCFTKEKIQRRYNEVKGEEAFHNKEKALRKFEQELQSANNSYNENSPIQNKKNNYLNYTLINSKLKKSLKGGNDTLKVTDSNYNDKTNESTQANRIQSGKYKNNDVKYIISARPTTSHSKAHSIAFSNQLKSKTNSKSKEKLSVKQEQQNKEEVEKFQYSEYVFDKSYRKKVDFLSNLSNRELAIQKKILGLKKFEKIIIDDFDLKKVNDDCEFYFNKVLNMKSRVMKEDDNINKKKEILNEENRKVDRKRECLENKIIKSLDIKSFTELIDFDRRTSKPMFMLRQEFAHKTAVLVPDKNHLEKKNKECIINIDNEIRQLEKMEESNKNIMKGYDPKFMAAYVKKKQSFLKFNKGCDNFVALKHK
jgi:hypothetical protein